MKARTNKFHDYVPVPDSQRIDLTAALGQAYMSTHIPERRPGFMLFWVQLRYITPTYWAVQFCLLLLTAAFMLSSGNLSNSPGDFIFLISALIAVSAVPEITKDMSCGVTELEYVCRYSGGRILAVRLAAVNTVNLAALTALAAIVSITSPHSFIEILLPVLFSSNCVNIVNMLIALFFGIRSRGAVISLSLLAAGMIQSALEYTLGPLDIGYSIWAIPFAASAVLLLAEYAVLIPTEKRRILSWNYQ